MRTTRFTAAAAAAGIAASAAFPAPAAAAAEPSGGAGGLTPAAVDAYLERALEESGLPGISVAVVRDGKVVHTAGYGHDSEGEPVTEDTPMRIASLSKSFTAMAVMTLVEDGAIDLDGSVTDQLPEFSPADPRADRITVRDLLNQTSGLSDTEIDVEGLRDASSLEDYVSRLDGVRLASDPGTRMEYCNINYDLAARLVEAASGERFGDYVREAVFEPLGMEHSGLSDDEVPVADGHNSLYGLWIPRAERADFNDDSGAGGVVSTAADMGRWLTAHTGGPAPVGEESLQAMYAPSEADDYAMGWSPETGPGGAELMVHSGNLFTYNAAQGFDPETGDGFAVMSNGAPIADETYTLMLGLAALGRGEDPEGPGTARKTTDAVLAALGALALGLGAAGVLRSRRWAARRTGRPAWRTVLRILPPLVPAALFAGYPGTVSLLSNGREVTWEQTLWFALPLTLTLAAAALAGLATAAARLLRLRAAARRP
ncbi:serine hydrolase domain-containing protein [Nocardiopsis potens]|uniref:serine hydrolase domain-containing protein n=1 Tax=Nocardiopsis potens TaxID=1246458 RepID=UPI00034552E4|nr:serine hydrolase domain-containing protein [Nocardiopsis potens]